MRLVVSDHARAEAKRRQIDEATVLLVARKPEQRLSVRRGREIRQSRIPAATSGKLQLIRVIVDINTDAETIVTAYRTSKISKYWRAE